MAGFELSKWYADCVAGDGAAAIVYHARLRWRGIAIHYASLLALTPGSPPQVQYSLRKSAEPTVDCDEIRWQSPQWKVDGCWHRAAPACRVRLYESECGTLDWNCIAPRAEASLQVGTQLLRGWGYVEHLRLTLPPWQLPIQRLRWGRFVNDTDTLVWIDWNGSYNTRVVYLNGISAISAEISDEKVVLPASGAILALDKSTVLRDGSLKSTALRIIPNIDRLLPESILNMRECKWLSRATLSQPGQPDSTGSAIHEVVEWP